MYAHFKGVIEDVYDDSCVIDVNGVGYSVLISTQTRQNMHVGQTLKLHIETVIRAESMHLFGFLDTVDVSWFRLLTTVQGVGPKLALGILGSMNLNDLTRTILSQDKTMMTRADGVGPKLAGRILLELKDKPLPGPSSLRGLGGHTNEVGVSLVAPVPSSHFGAHYSDTLSALENLGYSKNEAKRALDHVLSDINENDAHEGGDDSTSADLLRRALRFMSPLR